MPDMDIIAEFVRSASAIGALSAWIWWLIKARKEEVVYYRAMYHECMADTKDAINKLELRITSHIDQSK